MLLWRQQNFYVDYSSRSLLAGLFDFRPDKPDNQFTNNIVGAGLPRPYGYNSNEKIIPYVDWQGFPTVLVLY
jgi:hypothetical protein